MSLGEAGNLKQQFQLIQEQQQKRLLARKQKQAKNSEKTTKENSENGSNSENLWAEDDLGLKLDVKIENETLCSNSELQELKDAVRVLKDENGRLYKLLGERDEEMRITRKQRDNERKALAGTGLAADTAAGKIVELSKKNREMTADLQSEKNKVRQLTRRIQQLERQESAQAPAENKPDQRSKPRSPTENQQDSEAVAGLQEKLNHANQKMAEYRNQCETLKKELKVATKVLSKEVGENVNMSSLLNEPSGWRGRQQQIITLQHKVADLKGQLQQVVRGGSVSSIATPLSGSQYDEKHKVMLKKIEKDRKDSQEKTQGELERVSEMYSRAQQKHEAAKARNTVLSNELKSVKAQLKTLLEKGAHDDELIAALMREKDLLKESKQQVSRPVPPQVMVSQADSAMIAHLRQVCQERDEKAKGLEQELRTVREELERSQAAAHQAQQRPQTATIACSTGDLPSQSTNDSTNQSADAMVSRDVMSDGECVSRGYVGSPARRNVVSRVSGPPARGALPPTPPSGGRHSRCRRNSAGSSDEVHTLRCQAQEYKSLCQAAEVERDRLMQLVALLQKRIDEEASKSLEATSKWQEQRRSNALLEKQLARVQSSHASKQQNANKAKPRGTGRADQDMESIDELQARLEIQTDENDALKEALQSTLRSKEEDMKYYQDMMEQTKKIFLQGLRQFRQGSAPS
ncbi:coiled-coil domain-containing protein 13 [Nematostella vectensis]|nr:coiled-coil domain-containing protein 13 [Nematostella vectensis]